MICLVCQGSGAERFPSQTGRWHRRICEECSGTGFNDDLQSRAQPTRTPDVLTTKQAAEYLGVNYHTMWEWRKKGIGPKYSRNGRTIRYNLADLQK